MRTLTLKNFLKKLKIPKKLNLGVMINAGDYLNKSDNPRVLIKKNFLLQSKSKIKLVRIACHFKEIFQIKELVDSLKKLGYETGINVMQISKDPKMKFCLQQRKLKNLM